MPCTDHLQLGLLLKHHQIMRLAELWPPRVHEQGELAPLIPACLA
jgi:hypothetical protein